MGLSTIEDTHNSIPSLCGGSEIELRDVIEFPLLGSRASFQ